MTREEARKLLGGYATGTLTEAEQAALFAMALEDQELFDELGREQALRDLMRDPAAKAQMLAALDGARERRPWWQMRPLIAGLAMAGVAAVCVVVWQETRPRPVMVAQMDRVETAAPSKDAVAVPEAQPAPVQKPPVQESRERKAQAPARNAMAPLNGRREEEALQKQVAQERDLAPPPPAAAAPVPSAPKALAAVKDEAPSANRAPASGVVAGVGGVAGGGGARKAPESAAESLAMQKLAVADALADKKVAVAPLRYSILRSDGEAEPGTVLHAGETVRLRIASEQRGLVAVTEGEQIVASGMAGPGQPFETPPLPFQGAGSRSLQVRFTAPAVSGAFAARQRAAERAPQLAITLTYQ